MISPKKENKLLFWSFLCLFGFEFLYILHDAKINVNTDNFFIVLYISITCLIALYRKNGWEKDMPKDGIMAYQLFLTCNAVALVRGMVTAAGYLDWKNTLISTGGGLSLIIPLAMVAGFSFSNSNRLLKLCILIFLGSFLMIPVSLFYFNEMYPRIVAWVVVFILLIPYFKNRERLIIIAVAAVSVGIALSWRANVLRIGLAFLFVSIYYFRKLITRSVLTAVQIVCFVLPLYFLYQGINGNSIFAKSADSEYNITENGEESNLAADTRTDLYKEVLTDLKSTGQLLFGKGSNGKYKTEHDFELLAQMGDERSSIEVGFLKILIYTGIAGMLLYTILLILAIYYATWHTNNTLTKILAMFLASHWLVLFLENSVEYNMYFFFVWFVTGLCFSKRFRSLNDAQIVEWIRFSR